MNASRTELIAIVKSPLAFVTLSLLIFEAFLFVFLNAVDSKFHELLIWSAILVPSPYVIGVFLLSIFKMEALMGRNSLKSAFAREIANDVYSVMNGYMDNLDKETQHDAWTTLADIFHNTQVEDREYQKFSQQISAKIVQLTGVSVESVDQGGNS